MVVLLRDQIQGFEMVFLPDPAAPSAAGAAGSDAGAPEAKEDGSRGELLAVHVVRMGACHYNLFQNEQEISAFRLTELPLALAPFAACHGWQPAWRLLDA